MSPSQDGLIGDQTSIFFRCVEDSNEPIMITNQRGALVYVNPAWSRIYGYSRDEALGQTPRLLRSRHQDDEFYRRMWRQILDPKIGHFRGQLINKAKDGHEVPVMLTIAPYRGVDGKTLGYMGIALDLSEQIRLEQQIINQERLATIGELTSGLAHEIGTPVGVIRGRAEMLSMTSDLPANVSKTLEIIIRQTDRISSLISTLLRFSRSGQVRVELKPVSLGRVVTEVTALLAEKLRRRNITVQNQVAEDAFVLGDPQRLEQVLLNLCLNSVHAIETAGKRGKLDGHHISIVATRESGHWTVDFTDSGTGIPPEVQDKIFLPFFTTKPTGEGTGLGLSIVSRLMHEMNGQVSLDPSYKMGARFKLTFQCGRADLSSPSPPSR